MSSPPLSPLETMWFGCRMKSLSLLSQSSTVEQNVRLHSGKSQYVLASQPNFDAAQLPAPNQRASWCSGLTKAYPKPLGGKKNLSKNKANSNVLVRGGCSQHYTQHPREGSAKFRGHKIWWISGRATEERSFPFKLRRPSRGRLVFPPLPHGPNHDGQTVSKNDLLAQDKYFSS